MIEFRKATEKDIDKIEEIYLEIHYLEERGETTTGWVRGVYPVRKTALSSLQRGDLFVLEADGEVKGSAIINKIQVPEYCNGNWRTKAPDDEVMVLHTLVISPKAGRKGYGKYFVEFYENYARKNGCLFLRMDTNEKNVRARAMYKKLGYYEAGIVPCNFNGIENIQLVLLEKTLCD